MAELEQVLESRTQNYYRNRKVSSPAQVDKIVAKRQNVWERDIILPTLEAAESENDSKPLDFVTPTLRDYIDELRKVQIQASEKASIEELKKHE